MGKVIILIEADNTDFEELKRAVEEVAPSIEWIGNAVKDEVYISILSGS